MWCPTCRAGYREGFTRCADCEVDLVEEEPKQLSSIEYGKPVVVFTTSNIHEAHLVAGLLEGSDINVRIFEGHLSSIHPFLINAVGGIKLIVDEEQAENAISVLKEYRGEEGTFPTVGDASPFDFASDKKPDSTEERPSKSRDCSKCKNVNEPDSNYCEKCGNDLNS